MNTVSRTRSRFLGLALGAVVLMAAGACTSAEDTVTSTSVTGDSAVSGTETTGSAETAATSDGAGTGQATAGPAPDTSAAVTEPEANTATAPAPATQEPVATTTVPAPGNGNINQTVPGVELTTAAAVPLTATADLGGGVTVNVAGIESVKTTAQLPGEIGGSGVKVSVTIRNDSAAAVSLDNTVVDVQDSAGTPSIAMTDGSSWFTGELAAGQSATGVYLFTLSDSFANPLTITISYSTDAPIVVFVGDAL